MLWTATMLLVLEAASVAWAWPHVERWAEAPELEAWTRTGERIAVQAGIAARTVTLGLVERASHRVLDATRGGWAWLGDDARAVTQSDAKDRVVLVHETTRSCQHADRVERDVVHVRRLVSPEALF